ncbi:MAG: thioredoxin family protein [Leptospiraceae bacterium]|nr:thioredoxin family protein [Leptospiraceae bacterium]MDW8307401.1 thioredoxin family protein [Leptospiraceae bacterium]
MAVESKSLPLGTIAPYFCLRDVVSGIKYTMNHVRGPKGMVIYFICNHCPYVIHVRQELVKVAQDYMPKGIGFAAISSNDVERYPEDSPEKMKQVAQEFGFPFPYFYDETQEVARDYQAACTPDIFVFDGYLRLYYHGQLDDARPGNNVPITGASLRLALDSLLEGKSPPEIQKPCVGCSIKWKEQN